VFNPFAIFSLSLNNNASNNNFTAIPLSTGKTLDVLNSVVIYGANASGKSNLIEALGAMLRIIDNSFSYQASKGVKSLVFNKLSVCFSLIERKLVTLNSKSILV
jgi:ABC-type cobalamin/Fe3+-siderophores transport system ATPase subunit